MFSMSIHGYRFVTCLFSGMSSDKNTAPFRPAYGQLGELRSLTTVPVIALTATACTKTREIIKEKLSTRQIGDLYQYLMYSLRQKAYVDFKPEGPNDDRNRLFDMFHSKTDDEVKESICSSFMDPQGTKRVVLVSTSFSMGLDVQGVDHVIHYGPAYDVEDYLQETGRGGRDPNTQAHAILMKYKRCLSGRNAVKPCMRQYCKGTSCRRVELLQHFESSPSKVSPPHDWCDVCALTCKCQCNCVETCDCGQTCNQISSLVMDKIRSPLYSSSDSSDTASDDDVSSDSEVDENTRRKPIVLTYSSESD
ncbi:ATP-dependent DNA helicase Q-like 3 [Haliotis rufescens]|uniref:ATP-dependent DNA helicase Q-like 3 n=1 Tax=Haliotis rufescens TaxID=6454 RepID=UPI00201F02F9|nr:ATP-dependent DNA helicase Q-like 3 [Haliotis rufescens]